MIWCRERSGVGKWVRQPFPNRKYVNVPLALAPATAEPSLLFRLRRIAPKRYVITHQPDIFARK